MKEIRLRVTKTPTAHQETTTRGCSWSLKVAISRTIKLLIAKIWNIPVAPNFFFILFFLWFTIQWYFDVFSTVGAPPNTAVECPSLFDYCFFSTQNVGLCCEFILVPKSFTTFRASCKPTSFHCHFDLLLCGRF